MALGVSETATDGAVAGFAATDTSWRIQEKAFGGHDKATERLLESYAGSGNTDRLYQRLKIGTVLIREYEGVRHAVVLGPEGFIWKERTFSSLSAIAKLITGTNWNGPRFFGVRESRKPQQTRKKTA